MSALTEKQIAAYESKGFKRWTKGNLDRLYINCTQYGCEFNYYKTGNISDAYFQGERVSNAEGYRFKSTKVYVDVNTGELHINTNTDYEDEIREAVEAIITEINDELAAAEKAEEEATKAEAETNDDENNGLIWSDLRKAIENAASAMNALANFGICDECEELKAITSASVAELEMWRKGMAILAEQREQHIDRDKVASAAKYHDALMDAVFNDGGKFDLTK